MKVHFTQFAQKEIQDALDYYDEISSTLGNTFIEEIKEAIYYIISFPTAWSKAGLRQRKYMLRRFPYFMLYVIYDDHILVTAFAHQHRHPDYIFRNGEHG